MNLQSESCTFFIDRCLGKHLICATLRSTGVQVEIHDDHFSQNAKDIEWIPEIGKRGWIILTKDTQIGFNELERQAVARAEVRMFTLASRKLSGAETAIAFKEALSSMMKFVDQHPHPFIAKVYKDGKVRAWWDAESLIKEIQ